MSVYNVKTIYSGNLVKCINREVILVKENILLIYDDKTDTFYDWSNTLNCFLDLELNNNLSKRQKEKYCEIIKKNNYPYSLEGIEGKTYIDETSIKISFSSEQKKK